jgi:tRNA A-37 threonylcarbamoyl transferase component Bud32
MITRERWQKIEEAFQAAVDQTPIERADTLSAVDDTLRAQVEDLLTRADAAEDLVPKIVGRAVSRMKRPTAPMVGRRIGAYQIERELGQGGMGAVYLASRVDEQYETRVAIKLLHRGLETEQAIARFRDERQILAALDHPSIVRLVDGGATSEGLPYLVMEYVHGMPITAYARERDLSVDERIELFRKVCAAVHYAHGKLIVHRDLKPSNILVTSDGTPKLLDFGIAKLLDTTGPRREAHTRTGMLLLTPEYASPEQARGESVSTASDVYSLGAVLYELLCGVPPHRFEGSSLDTLRKLLDETPARPSIAAPAERRRQLAGDLDNVLLKALDKEPARRYLSADHFAEDLHRHVQGLPVDARAATWSYRAGKFVRRNRLVVAAATVVAIALTAATGVSLAQARRADAQARLAAQQTRQAERRFADVRALANTLLFDIDDQIAPLSGSTSARELIVSRALVYLDRLAKEGSNDTGLSRELAAAYMKIGDIQGSSFAPSLGRPTEALASYAKASAIVDVIDPQQTPENRALRVQLLVGNAMLSSSTDPARADRLANEALALIATMPDSAQAARFATLADLTLYQIVSVSNQIDRLPAICAALFDAARRWSRLEATPESRYFEAVSRETLADAAGLSGDGDRAAAMFGEAATLFAALVDEYPNRASYQRERRHALDKQATFQIGADIGTLWLPSSDQRDEGIARLRESLGMWKRARDDDPEDVRIYIDIASTQLLIAVLASDSEALPVLGELQRVLRDVPESARSWTVISEMVGFSHCVSAPLLAAAGRARDARDEINAARTWSPTSTVQLMKEQCEFVLARAFERLGDHDAAVATLDAVASALRGVLEREPGNILARIGLVETLVRKSEVKGNAHCAPAIDEAVRVLTEWPSTRTAYMERRLKALTSSGCGKTM